MPRYLKDKDFTCFYLAADFVLLATEDRLYCWDLVRNSTYGYKCDGVQCIMVLDCLNRKADLTKFKHPQAELVFIALKSGEIILLNLFLDKKKFEVNVSERIEQGDQQISSCVFMPKNGRLF